MICGLKSPTFVDLKFKLSECYKLESVGWHKALRQALSQILRFGGQNKQFGGKIFVFLTVYV